MRMDAGEYDPEFAIELRVDTPQRQRRCAGGGDNELLCRARIRSGALALPGTSDSGHSERHKGARDFA
jgi:hypothetical protein